MLLPGQALLSTQAPQGSHNLILCADSDCRTNFETTGSQLATNVAFPSHRLSRERRHVLQRDCPGSLFSSHHPRSVIVALLQLINMQVESAGPGARNHRLLLYGLDSPASAEDNSENIRFQDGNTSAFLAVCLVVAQWLVALAASQ